jgi:hypothetical protein
LHGVDKVEKDEKTRYCLVSNLIEKNDWKKTKWLKEELDAREKK